MVSYYEMRSFFFVQILGEVSLEYAKNHVFGHDENSLLIILIEQKNKII